jgi:hypothetical protein
MNEPEDRNNKPVKCCTSWENHSKSHQNDSEFSNHGVASQDKNGHNKTDNSEGFSVYA